MPVLVNPKRNRDADLPFAAGVCPNNSFHRDATGAWSIDATRCGDCPGPCLNFADSDTLRWADDLFELDLVRGQLEGTLTADEVAEQRAARAEQDRAAKAAAAAAAVGLTAVTRANFQAEVLDAEVPVLMDCWAAWCGPCRQFAPTFEAYAAAHAGTVKCVKLNSDEEPALARSLGIAALPTLLLFYGGQLIDGAQGALSAQQLESWAGQRLQAVQKMDGLSAAPATSAAAGPPAAANRAEPSLPKLYLP